MSITSCIFLLIYIIWSYDKNKNCLEWLKMFHSSYGRAVLVM